MLAPKCDRCGKEMSSWYEITVEHRIKIFNGGLVPDPSIRRHTIDICDDCQKEITEAFKKRKEENGGEDGWNNRDDPEQTHHT